MCYEFSYHAEETVKFNEKKSMFVQWIQTEICY